MSRPVRGASIETSRHTSSSWWRASRPVRGAWIETNVPLRVLPPIMSRPVQGAWIETTPRGPGRRPSYRVASRAGRVDRNNIVLPEAGSIASRVPCGARGSKPMTLPAHYQQVASRPVRGGWIETGKAPSGAALRQVASRAGRVDRNEAYVFDESGEPGRVPCGARGSKPSIIARPIAGLVASRAGRVDRNNASNGTGEPPASRPVRGA